MEKGLNSATVRFGGFLISLILVVIGVQWFARGSIVMPLKGIFLVGTQARAARAIWIFVGVGTGVYPFLKPRFSLSIIGAAALTAGLLFGFAVAGFAAVRLAPLMALLVGVAASLCLAVPGFVICGVAAEARRQEKMIPKSDP
jgi:hypothetical protein